MKKFMQSLENKKVLSLGAQSDQSQSEFATGNVTCVDLIDSQFLINANEKQSNTV